MFERQASAVWNGTLKEGNGTMSAPSGVLKEAKYTWAQRFANDPGTNPEELIAAAHAGCFSMAFAGKLTGAGFPPDRIATTATVTLEKTDAGMSVTKIHLSTRVRVPGISASAFTEQAENARATCPISRLLAPAAQITLDAAQE
ncbi:MAG TPA: OsmC family protein [Gemmatimonadaceae bacterium]